MFIEIRDEKEFMQSLGKLFERKLREMHKPDHDPLYTRQEAAKYLRRSLSWLDTNTREGKLKRVKVGGAKLFRKSDLDKALETE